MRTYKNPAAQKQQLLCKRPGMDGGELEKMVGNVFDNVSDYGDKAVLAYTKQFDEVELSDYLLVEPELRTLAANTPAELKIALDIAYQNIQAFHRAQELDISKQTVETMPGVVCWRESRPIPRVGLYVPGGTAPLVSAVLMLGVPAQIAGCREVVLCTPPNTKGTTEPAICYAALLCGIRKLYLVGGAQAIAAMATGTESIPKVDKIFGPGNQYVTAAKQYAAKFYVAIDMPAGPSEVMVIADSTAKPAFVAADLLSQAEHGPDSQVVLLTTEQKLEADVQLELKAQLERLPRKAIAKKALTKSFCIVFENLASAIDFANVYAPEHLILSVDKPNLWSKKVLNAGSVFLGNYSPESAGDYASGTNHTLPTGGWSRSYGGVSLDSFVKKVTFQSLSKAGLDALASTIEIIAEAEGLMAHANAVRNRRQP